MNKLFQYLKSLIKANTLDSSKSFGLLCSILTGSLLCLCIMFCLIWDVCTNGYIKTNLSDLGVFVGCIGLYMAGGSLPKAMSDVSRRKSKIKIDKNGERNAGSNS